MKSNEHPLDFSVTVYFPRAGGEALVIGARAVDGQMLEQPPVRALDERLLTNDPVQFLISHRPIEITVRPTRDRRSRVSVLQQHVGAKSAKQLARDFPVALCAFCVSGNLGVDLLRDNGAGGWSGVATTSVTDREGMPRVATLFSERMIEAQRDRES